MAEATLSRRSFLTARRPAGREPSGFAVTLRPPGISQDSLKACTGCGICAETCPTDIITIVDGLPTVDFRLGECTFCGKCADSCPEPVFEDIAPAFNHIAGISETCLVHAGVSCLSCRDACPEDAIRFRPRMGGPFLPEVREEVCTGCGACVAPCPADAITMQFEIAETPHA